MSSGALIVAMKNSLFSFIPADVQLKFDGNEPYLKNTLYGSVPAAVQGGEPSNKILNNIGNYVAKSWNPNDQVFGNGSLDSDKSQRVSEHFSADAYEFNVAFKGSCCLLHVVETFSADKERRNPSE